MIKWISVKDKLPKMTKSKNSRVKESDEVAAIVNGKETTAVLQRGTYASDGVDWTYWRGTTRETVDSINDHITHWAELNLPGDDND